MSAVCVALLMVASVRAAAAPSTDATSPAKQRTDPQDLDVPLPPAVAGRRITAIDLRGLERTHRRVVTRELTLVVGQPLRRADLRESVRRLRNLGIFRRVDVHLTPAGGAAQPDVVVTLDVDEKWTLLPIFSAGRGGGRLFLQVGAQDIHTAGRYLDLQAYWWLFAGTHSAVLAFADPRLLHRRFRATIVVEHGNRNRYVFGEGGVAHGGWSRHRDRVTLALADLRTPERTWGLDVHALRDRFSTRLLGAAFQTAGREGEPGNSLLGGAGLPKPGAWLIPSLWSQLGRVDRDDYLERGAWVRGRLSAGRPVGWSHRGWMRATLDAKAAWLGPARLNLVGRLRLGLQTRGHPEHRFFVGGYTNVRGYLESRFAGEQLAAVNLEARISSVHNRWAALQHVLFVDAGVVGRGWPAEAVRDGGWSLGGGVRGILPLVARFVARLDIAWAPRDDDWRVSFGAQQFF